MKTIFLLFVLLLAGNNGYGQKWCGTELTPQQIARERARLQSAVASVPAPSNGVPKCCLNRNISLTFWIVKDKSGNPNVSPTDIANSVAQLNADFAPICLSFNDCVINYIDDWNYDILLMPEENGQLTTLYHTDHTLNVYIVQTLLKDVGDTVCGLGGGSIWMGKGCLTGKTFSHEMGHVFGLPHTFETAFGNELANGSNCATAGDLICDTPADPKGEAGPDCQLDPYTQDANGDWYVPDIGNIMSYYSDGCTCGFTVGQFDKMCDVYYSTWYSLW